jgi:inorganic phosphate transporter, PiT family
VHIPYTTILIVIVALIFEFINGFHDTANAVATSISTKSLEPHQAIIISAVFNLIGAFTGTAVALTIAEGFASPNFATTSVILAALFAAIIWNLVTWILEVPSSSSHALIGGLVGSIIYSSGFQVIHYRNIIFKVFIPMIVSPILGFILALILVIIIHRTFKNNHEPRRINNNIREIQVISTAFLSFSHGANDAQKTMGIITLTLISDHLITKAAVPMWVILACALCMALGTFSGGMRIIKTLSTRVAKLKPVSGFAAEISSATLLFIGAKFGMPMSTTHAVSGAIMGAGHLGINWKVVKKMVISWVLTFPSSAILAAVILKLFF